MILNITSLSFTGVAFSNKNEDTKVEENINSIKNVYEPNTQTYVTEEGKEHTIYWAQGITPPKMTSNKSELGKPGFFEKDEIKTKTDTYITYQAPLETGKGYYDVNKNPNNMSDSVPSEKSLCYLGASTNLLYWWINQNREYINTYVDRLKAGNIYGQVDGLKKIVPYDEKTWNDILSEPPLDFINNVFYGQQLCTSPLAQGPLINYFYRKDGYYMDKVIDFFINGYPAQDDVHPEENKESEFKKDSRGGFFYPIFGTERLTERVETGIQSKFDYYNDNLARYFNEGKAISLSYYVGAGISHALTMWGAEYDENNRLCRVYVTDSDDFYNQAIYKSDTLRGIHGMDIYRDSNGGAFLTNKIGATKGSQVNGIMTLDLAQDIWEKKLADTAPPQSPVIKNQSQNITCPKGSTAVILSVEAEITDTGFLTYNWFECDKNGDNIKAIENPIDDKFFGKPTFKPSADEYGTRYYYCEITNNKNGKTTVTKSKIMSVTADNTPLTNVETPNVRFNASGIQVKQYGYVSPFYADASVKDGGTLTYQWYGATDSSGSTRWKLEGETSPFFTPSVGNIGTNYYLCEVTNTNPNATGTKVAVKRTMGKKVMITSGGQLFDAFAPVIVTYSNDKIYDQFENANPIEIFAKSRDGGKITYQWYKSNDKFAEGTPIVNATSSTCKPDTSKIGDTYYYCVVTNNNLKAENNTSNSLESERIKVTINGNSPIVPDKITSPKYEITNGHIENITAGQTVSELKNNLHGGEFVKIYKDNAEITSDSKLATGMVIKLLSGNVVVDSCVVVVNGDVSGDGNADDDDFQTIVDYMSGSATINDECYFLAGDVNKDGAVDGFDAVEIANMKK